MKTDLRVASCRERIEEIADAWLAANVKRGWRCVAQEEGRCAFEAEEERSGPQRGVAFVEAPPKKEAPAPADLATAPGLSAHSVRDMEEGEAPIGAPPKEKPSPENEKQHAPLSAGVAFPRSSSANFPVALRRARALAAHGKLEIEADGKGRMLRVGLSLDASGLVENAVRLENLIRLVSSWRGAELSIGGEPASRFEFDTLLEELANLRRCWRRKKKQKEAQGGNPCHADCALGCRHLRVEPSQSFLGFLNFADMPWFGVGSFDGKAVQVDKAAIRGQIDGWRNERLSLCPLFDREEVLKRIDALPGVLDPEKDAKWGLVHSRKTEAPIWVLPKQFSPLPYDLTFDEKAKPQAPAAHAAFGLPAAGEESLPGPREKIPTARFCDVRGQDRAVEAVRDCIELPLRHATLFERVGVGGGGGVLLYGPPGNGKTLLARAAAGEANAHIEIVSGPEILSKWVGEAESALRGTFERARRLAPSVILFDEIDAVAPSREMADAVHQKILVSQLLVLLDGLEARGQVFVIATTNRPQDIDSAVKRPGRIDRLVYVGPPDEAGRAAIFEKYLSEMRAGPSVDAGQLAAETPGFSGAQIAAFCRHAGLLCVKEAVRNGTLEESVEIEPRHFQEALRSLAGDASTGPQAAAALSSQN